MSQQCKGRADVYSSIRRGVASDNPHAVVTIGRNCGAHRLGTRVLAGDIREMSPLRSAAFVVRLTMAVVVLHGLEILLWAGFYSWRCLPSWDSATYFSASSYSTLGCDISLPLSWRTLPMERVIGVLMCGISVSLLFAIVTRLINREEQFSLRKNELALRTAASSRGASYARKSQIGDS